MWQVLQSLDFSRLHDLAPFEPLSHDVQKQFFTATFVPLFLPQDQCTNNLLSLWFPVPTLFSQVVHCVINSSHFAVYPLQIIKMKQ